jgi:hypothetical protein
MLNDLSKFISKNEESHAYDLQYLIETGDTMPELKKIWGSHIFENSLIHFPSLRGSGKSMLMLQICVAVSSKQKEFLGEPIEVSGKTLYIDFEMPEAFIKRRAAKLAKDPPFPIKRFSRNVIFLITRQSFEAEYSTIITIIKQESPVLVVIDNLRTAIKNANSNSSIDMANFFSILGAIREKYNCAIVVIDHLRKGSRHQKSDSDMQSGSGTKTDLSDGDFLLRHSCQDKDLRLIKRIKSRMFEESEETKLVKLNRETLWFEFVEKSVNEAEHIGISLISDKDELIDIAKDMRDQGKSLQEIASALSKPKSTIHRWVGEKPSTE